jgi:hypothetical protein
MRQTASKVAMRIATMFAVCAGVLLAQPAFAADRQSSVTAPAVKLAAKGKGKKGGSKPAEAKPVAPEEKRPPSDPRAAAAAAADEGGGGGGPVDPGARRGMARIEFDDRLIQGQTNKANAIYLFERRESALRSLLKKRSDFRDEIDETLEQ